MTVNQIPAKQSGIVRMVQITDTHLYADKKADLLGINTFDSFMSVVALAENRINNADLVLCTGDIAQDHSPQAYQYFAKEIQRLNMPSFCLAGNHDEVSLLTKLHINGACKVVHANNWALMLLHTPVYKKVHGHLEVDELTWLKEQLDANTQEHVLICCHHQPIDVGAKWLDNIGIHNSGALLELLKSYPEVRGVLWGHVHQEVDEQHQGLRMLATPSTCIQFKKYSDDFALDTLQPGFRHLDLHSNGDIETQVHRLPVGSYLPDMESTGY